MPIKLAEIDLSQVAGGDRNNKQERVGVRASQLMDVCRSLANGYDQLLAEWSRLGKSTQYFDEPATLMTELVAYAESGEDTEPSEFVESFFRQAGLTEEDRLDLKELIKTQIDVIDNFIDAMLTADENGEDLSEEDLILLASFNQRLSTYFYLAAKQKPTEPSYKAASLISGLSSAIGKLNRPKTEFLLGVVDGARTQSAICQTLDRAGYEIILPQHSDIQEIIDWDLNGVDLAAISPDGEIVLIDAMGRRYDQSEGRSEINAAVGLDEKGVFAVHRKIVNQVIELSTQSPQIPDSDQLDPENVKRVELKLPTDGVFMGPLGQLDQHRQKSIIRKLSI